MHSEKVGAFRANRTEKVGAFRANKTQKGALYRGTYPYCFTRTPPGTTYTEALFLDLHISIGNGFDSSKMYYKRDDFGMI